jgi:rhodanese-related sulfurtransferase
MTKRFFSVFAITVAVFLWSCKEQNQSVIEMVTADEMVDLIDQLDYKLLDVRTPDEYKSGTIAGAYNMDYLSEAFNIQIKTLDPTEPIVVFCKSGKRSSACAEFLEKQGFVKIYNLKGGITQWTNLGLPIVLPE